MKSRSIRYGFTYKCASCRKEFWVADPSQWIYKNANSFKMYCYIPVIGLGKRNPKSRSRKI